MQPICECDYSMCAGHEPRECEATAFVQHKDKALCMSCAILADEYENGIDEGRNE